MMRGSFNSGKTVDYGDGHIVLDAQQQMAFVEQMRHAEAMEWMPRRGVGRNPLLAEETGRTERERRIVIRREKPDDRVLIGGQFVRKDQLATGRRDDYKRITMAKERREAGTYYDEEDEGMGGNQNQDSMSARERLEEVQRMQREATFRLDSGRYSGRSAGRSTGRSTGRPQSAASYRSAHQSVYDRDPTPRPRPQSARPTKATETFKGVRSKELKKLALTRPKVAAAVRARRAEDFLDETAARRSIKQRARPTTAKARVETSRSSRPPRPGTAPSARGPIPATHENPAATGIPPGGNWKSVGEYKYNETAPSQLPAPWATHYQSFERFPETKLSQRSKTTKMLETKMLEIQSQLAEVERELSERRKERQGLTESFNKTRAANGLPPKSKQYGGVRKTKKQPNKSQKGYMTVSKSARAYMDKL